MQTLHVYKRLTHKYVDSCRHLDQHQFLATVKVTSPRLVREGNGHDDGGEYVRFARLPAGQATPEMREAIAENLGKWGCTHEYDCCGCELVRVRAHTTKHPRIVRLTVSVGYNY